MVWGDFMSDLEDGEPQSAEQSVILATLAEVATEARTVANRFAGSMLALAGAVSVLPQRFLPERHPFLPDRATCWSLASFHARVLASISGVSVTIRGRGRLGEGGPFLFVANHESHFDLVALLGFLPGHKRFVATPECYRDRLLGTVLRTARILTIDQAASDVEVEGLKRVVAGGNSLIAFPEGGRGRGGRLREFSDLPFDLAIELGIPVVPVAIRGTGRILPRGALAGIRPGRIDVLIEEPIPTEDLLPQDCVPLREDVFGAIARNVELVGDLDSEEFERLDFDATGLEYNGASSA